MRTRGGAGLPALGLGTWRMGEDPSRRRQEVAALRLGLDLGMTLIDTAEMYASGVAEEITGEAIRGRRDEVYLVSKVLPSNASRTGTVEAAERSLKRLGTDHIDLYLLHWQGSHPLEDTLEALQQLVDEQKILHFGVSNFDTDELQDAERHPLGENITVNQVMYNLGRRGIEWSLLPWCAERAVAVMAYAPLEQGRLRTQTALNSVAARHHVAVESVAIGWTLRHPLMVSIPKASNPDHVRANAAAMTLELTEEDIAALDRAYPAPRRKVSLDMT